MQGKLNHAAIRAYYFRKGNNAEKWQVVNNNPELFNQVWREALGIEKGKTPPSKSWR
jgi:hypothetical protein